MSPNCIILLSSHAPDFLVHCVLIRRQLLAAQCFIQYKPNCVAMSKATLTLICHLPCAFQHPAQHHARVQTGVWTGHFEPSLSSHKHRFTAVSGSRQAPGCCSSAACPTHHRKASSRATTAVLLSLPSSWEQQRALHSFTFPSSL